MIDNLEVKDMERLEGSQYRFYIEMAKFLKDTPYKKTLEFVNKKSEKILITKKKLVEDIKVTVVIPFYNRIDLLLNSLDSVIKQTHNNIEIILINDGSLDDISPLKEKIRNDSRIKLINFKHNRGVSAARNEGFKRATGEYIALLDSDDLFINDKIEIQLLEMILNNSVMSHTSYIRRSSEKDDIMSSGSLDGNVVPGLIYSCPIATPTVMLKRDFIINHDIKYKEDYKIGEDVCLYLEILKSNRLLGIDRALTIVNVNENSAAYNFDKQFTGLKNILSFVLNDEKYKTENYAIAHLANHLANFYFSSHDIYNSDQTMCPECKRMLESKSWRITKPLRTCSLVWNTFRKYGPVITTQKIFRRIKKLSKNKSDKSE